jgi:hypothetical protein
MKHKLIKEECNCELCQVLKKHNITDSNEVDTVIRIADLKVDLKIAEAIREKYGLTNPNIDKAIEDLLIADDKMRTEQLNKKLMDVNSDSPVVYAIPFSKEDSAALTKMLREALGKDGVVAINSGNVPGYDPSKTLH